VGSRMGRNSLPLPALSMAGAIPTGVISTGLPREESSCAPEAEQPANGRHAWASAGTTPNRPSADGTRRVRPARLRHRGLLARKRSSVHQTRVANTAATAGAKGANGRQHHLCSEPREGALVTPPEPRLLRSPPSGDRVSTDSSPSGIECCIPLPSQGAPRPWRIAERVQGGLPGRAQRCGRRALQLCERARCPS
jgi:hypothetical protein